MGRPVKTRGRPHRHGGRRSSSSSSTQHLMGSGPGRPGQNTWAASWAGRSVPYRSHLLLPAARPGPSNFEWMSRSPARPIKISEDGPRLDPTSHFQLFPARLGPAYQCFTRLGSARRGPSQALARPDTARQNLSKSRAGPARLITFSNVSAWPGPSQFPDWPGLARPRQTAPDQPGRIPG